MRTREIIMRKTIKYGFGLKIITGQNQEKDFLDTS